MRLIHSAGAAVLVLALAAPVPATAASGRAEFVGLVAGQGAGDINQTRDRFAVHATDLGVMWRDSRGRTAIAFGDTYGAGWGGNGAGPETADWRFNVLAHSTDQNLADGLRIDSMVTDRPGHAKQLLGGDPDVDEVTVIPTAAISVGSRDYLHYMSVRSWGPAGTWVTNFAGLAYSDDGGVTWTKSVRLANSGTTAKFQLGAFVRQGEHVYLFGTPNGRLGNAFVARVRSAQVLDLGAYEYWTASGWSPVGDPIPVMSGQVGELSVQYNSFLGRWVAMHLDEGRAAIVLRTAPTPTGPWSGGQVVAHANDHPGLYGAYLHPDNHRDLYFAMSRWDPYHVELMRLPLNGFPLDQNLVRNGGFEDWPGTWQVNGQGGIDRGLGLARTGANNGFVRNKSGWNDLHEQVVVQPGKRYRLTGWLRTSASNTDGYFGVRGSQRAEQKFGQLGQYTKLTVEFLATDANLEVFAGTWATHGDTWVQVDDVVLEQTD
ncbi:DUF4185 domain-containing protein [Lentzea sp. NPDC051213]|uniref:DUF4185 domain-containing protein n=1 Tax=Lentzea sp. NPDC051213 TaxID=3364126 RepID=UPI0037A36E9A